MDLTQRAAKGDESAKAALAAIATRVDRPCQP